jgi:hypothetical protein
VASPKGRPSCRGWHSQWQSHNSSWSYSRIFVHSRVPMCQVGIWWRRCLRPIHFGIRICPAPHISHFGTAGRKWLNEKCAILT